MSFGMECGFPMTQDLEQLDFSFILVVLFCINIVLSSPTFVEFQDFAIAHAYNCSKRVRQPKDDQQHSQDR